MITIFDQMAEEEDALNHELDLLDQIVEQSEQQKPIVGGISKPPLPKIPQQNFQSTEAFKENIQSNNSRLDEVKQRIERLDEKIKLNGDKNCGWDIEDHREFLRLRTKHHGKIQSNQFLNDCLNTLPLQTEETILEHIDIYQKYLDYEEEKKDLVTEYKKLKEDLKKQMIQEVEENQKKQEEKTKKMKSSEEINEEKVKQKELIKQWKIKKISEKMVGNDLDDEQKRELERMKWEKQEQERIMKKNMVQIYKEQKQYEKLREKEEEQIMSMQKRQLSYDAKIRIKEKEDEIVRKRRIKAENDARKKELEDEKMRKVQDGKQIKFAHIDSKLSVPTKAIEQHKRTKFDPKVDQPKYAETFGGNLLGAGRRAIPQWRQGMA